MTLYKHYLDTIKSVRPAIQLSATFCLAIIGAAITVAVFLANLVSTKEDNVTPSHGEYRDNLLVSVGFTTAVTIQTIFEAINYFRKGNEDVKFNHCFPSRILLLFSLQICDICIYRLVDNQAYDVETFQRVYVAILSFKIVTIVGCIASIISDQLNSSLQNFDSFMSTSRQLSMLFVTALFFQAMILFSYGPRSHKSFGVVTFGILSFLVLQVITLCFRCFLNWLTKYVKDDISAISDREDKVVGICLVMMLLMVASTVFAYSTCLSGITDERLSSIYTTGLSVVQYTQLAVTIGVVVAPWRLDEWFLLDFFAATLGENSSFLRYVAHEVRAALNVTELSLAFSKQQAKRISSRKQPGEFGSIVEAIGDAYDSCNSAISILNDVLLFDKMRGRWMIRYSVVFVVELFKPYLP